MVKNGELNDDDDANDENFLFQHFLVLRIHLNIMKLL